MWQFHPEIARGYIQEQIVAEIGKPKREFPLELVGDDIKEAVRTFSYDPTRRFDSTQLGMAAKPDYPTGYLRQMIYPFTRGGGCALKSTTTTANPTTDLASDPTANYRR